MPGQAVAARLRPWTHGSFSPLFDGPTTAQPAGHLVVWSVRQLPDELRAAGMLLALDAIWRGIDTPTRSGLDHERAGRRLVVVDEAWTLLRDTAGARFLYRMAKAARKRSAGLVVVTQDAADLLASELGQAVAANAATQILMRQAPQAIEAVDRRLRPHRRRSPQPTDSAPRARPPARRHPPGRVPCPRLTRRAHPLPGLGTSCPASNHAHDGRGTTTCPGRRGRRRRRDPRTRTAGPRIPLGTCPPRHERGRRLERSSSPSWSCPVAAALALARWRHRRLARHSQVVQLVPPPVVEPGGAVVFWATLAELLTTARRWRWAYGNAHAGLEYRWDGRRLTIVCWVPGTIPASLVAAAARAAWPGTSTEITRSGAPMPERGRRGVAEGGALVPLLPAGHPLRGDHDVDPLRPLLQAASGLAAGEHACVQVLARPAAPHQAVRMRTRAMRMRSGGSHRCRVRRRCGGRGDGSGAGGARSRQSTARPWPSRSRICSEQDHRSGT